MTVSISFTRQELEARKTTTRTVERGRRFFALGALILELILEGVDGIAALEDHLVISTEDGGGWGRFAYVTKLS